MTACSSVYMRQWCLTSTASEHVELALGGSAVQQTIYFTGAQAVAQLSAEGGNCTACALSALIHGCGSQNINHKKSCRARSSCILPITFALCTSDYSNERVLQRDGAHLHYGRCWAGCGHMLCPGPGWSAGTPGTAQ